MTKEIAIHNLYALKLRSKSLSDRDALDMAINLLKQTRWIPVSERLPEDGQHVMVTFGGKIAFCLAQDNNGTLTEITSIISKDANVLWLYPEDEWGDGYVAWMPLPTPYQPPKMMCEED